ncbi:MAG: hypothetical protein QOI06_2886 [Nocardioidaceae bacterium]|jgi:uncharacterized protein (DUF1800 family)|nr:hypothetical protein [Nocardioidaceae bacterium]
MRTPFKGHHVPITRRSALVGSAAVGATAVLPVSAAAAATKVRTRVARPATNHSAGTFAASTNHAFQLPDGKTRNILSRFTSGVNAERLADVAAEGGIDAWFEHQLAPGNISNKKADATSAWFPVLAMTPQQRFARYKAGTQNGAEMMQDFASWTMLRRLFSKRAVDELMVDFWSNLLHTASPANNVWPWRIEYDQMIRRHALGDFDSLLKAAIQHPAMGLYLNNVLSTADAINENLGRELLECHTVGVGNYTEHDVINSARILTGFQVDQKLTWDQTYHPEDHWMGRVKVMAFRAPNAKANGIPVLLKYLTYLSHHPLTAQRLCRRLAIRFMSDNPSDALVTSLANVYLDSNTEIVPVLRALVTSDEFLSSSMQKVRTPVEDALATWTAIGAVVTQPHSPDDAGNQFINVSKAIGQVVFSWPTPDAFPDLAPAWSGAGRMLGSFRVHWYAACGAYPNQGITFLTPLDWMPQLPLQFKDVVDHVVRSVLFLPSTLSMQVAATIATDIQPTDVITTSHALVTHSFPRLLVSILDTVEHLSR